MSIRFEEVQTGLFLLDKQHERYYNTAKKVFELCETEDASIEDLTDLLSQTREYAVDNFDTEEYLMSLEDYPKFDEHKTKHDYFKDELDTIAERLSSGGTKDIKKAASELSTLLIDWFNQQIKQDDMELASFLKARNA